MFNVDIQLAQHCALQTHPFPLECGGAFILSYHECVYFCVFFQRSFVCP